MIPFVPGTPIIPMAKVGRFWSSPITSPQPPNLTPRTSRTLPHQRKTSRVESP